MRTSDVAVTGVGMVTPAGIGVTASWAGVCAGVSAASTDPALKEHAVRFSCRVPGFDADELLGGRVARRLDRFVQLAIVAAREALSDSALDPRTWAGARVGVVLGCSGGGAATTEEQARILERSGPDQVSALLFPKQLPNMLAGQLSIEFGATGPSMVVATACASATSAIGVATDLLRLDRCDVVLTGGSEAMVTPLAMAGFAQMRALSTRNDDPRAACRPFDAYRDGLVAGEGAGILVLERSADARARGARIRARVIGHGSSADAHHVTVPDPEGAGLEKALRAALDDAGVGGDDVQHVNAHGTSTRMNDIAEARALTRVMGTTALVTSTKGVTGHLLGAAGAVEAIFTVLSLETGLVPPTANLTRLDPGVDVDVAAELTEHRPRVAVSNSAGFGGQNAALVIAAA